MRFDPEIGLIKKLDKNLQISFGYHDLNPEKNKTGAIIRRDSKEERAHVELRETTHPDTDKICLNVMSYALCRGRIRVKWEWTEADGITENDVNIFKTYHENLTCSSMFDINYDMAAKQFSIDVEYKPTFINWEDLPMKWDLDSPVGGIEWLSDDVEMLCMIRVQDVTAWNVRQKDLWPGEETVVQKSGDECYIINTNKILVNNTKEGERIDGLKLVSDSAVYKNISSEPQKILKFYK